MWIDFWLAGFVGKARESWKLTIVTNGTFFFVGISCQILSFYAIDIKGKAFASKSPSTLLKKAICCHVLHLVTFWKRFSVKSYSIRYVSKCWGAHIICSLVLGISSTIESCMQITHYNHNKSELYICAMYFDYICNLSRIRRLL